MNRFDKFVLVVALLVTLLCARTIVTIFQYHLETLAPKSLATCIAGWLIATAGPLVIATWCWRKAKHARFPWMVHLGMLACAFVLLKTGLTIMLATLDQPDFDVMMGGPSNPPLILFLFVIGGYLMGLAYRRISSSGRKR